MENNNKILSDISAKMIERYSARYREKGYHIRTLGWGSKEQQRYRFTQTLQCDVDFGGASLLDIGCGFGDYFQFLQENSIEVGHYSGWDLNPDLIAEARRRIQNETVDFAVKNVLQSEDLPANHSDIVVMNGLLNLNLKGEFDNYMYSQMAIRNAFSCAKKALIVDFLSSKLTPEYPQEDFVFYHDPARMLNFALSLTPNVTLHHNYLPIPQKEFMLFLYK